MKLHVFGLGCLLAFAGAGCSTFGAKPYRPSTYPSIDARGAYPPWRLIGVKNDPEAPCPEIPGWTVGQLFPLGTQQGPCGGGEPDDNGKALIAVGKQMDAFCLYEEGKGRRVIPQAAALGLARLEPDAVAMTAAVQIPGTTGTLGSSIGPNLEQHFVQQVGGGGQSPQPSQVSVRLAFLDSEPVGDGFTKKNYRMEHGHFLRLLGSKLAGPNVKITTQLALPILTFHADDPDGSTRDPNGGYIGSFADLAKAIHDEVTAWTNQGPEHLVLNLSVGWDGERFGGLTETRVCDLPPGPRAVYLALEEAARKGALIFASAGNAQPGPHASTGPLLPAAWVRGNIRESACGQELKAPLLYAVGAVQSDGKPLANARKGGMPELAAYGDHVVVTDGGNPTSTYTGTSVATAVVSSIAARIWSEESRRGDSPGAIVENLIKMRGKDLRYPADFFFPDGSRPDVYQIALCNSGTNCPPEGPVVLDFPEDVVASVRFEQATRVPENCGGPGPHCPAQTYDDHWRDAWVIPQPESDPCPSCMMGPPRNIAAGDPTRVLHGEISKEWQAAWDQEKLTAATLEAVSQGGVHTRHEFVVNWNYRDTPQFDITLPGSDFSDGPPVKAIITWVVTSSRRISSINSPVLIFKRPGS
ncbi:MAG TPA: S8/S53 family peptidase [Thermoanaerobaculia bacterium]|nr:S8/S53 family peptidase [Thermoanaerobaculia bacterium]